MYFDALFGVRLKSLKLAYPLFMAIDIVAATVFGIGYHDAPSIYAVFTDPLFFMLIFCGRAFVFCSPIMINAIIHRFIKQPVR